VLKHDRKPVSDAELLRWEDQTRHSSQVTGGFTGPERSHDAKYGMVNCFLSSLYLLGITQLQAAPEAFDTCTSSWDPRQEKRLILPMLPGSNCAFLRGFKPPPKMLPQVVFALVCEAACAVLRGILPQVQLQLQPCA
jgi:hypothetical protein